MSARFDPGKRQDLCEVLSTYFQHLNPNRDDPNNMTRGIEQRYIRTYRSVIQRLPLEFSRSYRAFPNCAMLTEMELKGWSAWAARQEAHRSQLCGGRRGRRARRQSKAARLTPKPPMLWSVFLVE